MRLAVMLLVGVVAVFPVVSERAFAQKQKKPASIAPAEPLKPGWEEIDKRLVFLMVRLANVEAGLDAVEKRVGAGARQRAAKAGEAKRAEKGNEMMDRKGGGPVKWSQFYGRTAEKFFYHPVDRNTSYHTTTVLSQKSPQADNQSGEGVPSRQGLPVHQRPPQFDYIYKANQDAQARAERDAAQLRDKIDALQARRRQLEDEQAALWCQIAFRAVSRHDLARKPLYRFEPIPGAGDTESRQQAEATKAAAIFMRRTLSIVEEAEKDQAKAFGSIKLVVADAHSKFDDGLLPLETLAKDTTDLKTAIGRFSALARRLKDVADNLSDSYEVSIDGDRFKDELRKDTFRGLLQESLVDYAEVVLALNEMGQVLESEWKTKPDVNTPLKFVSLEVRSNIDRPITSTESNSANSIGSPSNERPQPPAASSIDGLQGEWKTVRLQGQGEDKTDSDWCRVGKLTIEERQFTFVMLDGVYRGDLILDDSTIPKQITFKTTHLEKANADREKGMELRGIYRFDGDELTCCWVIWIPGVEELPRPTIFDTEKDESLKAKARNPAYIDLPRAGGVKYVFRRQAQGLSKAERSGAVGHLSSPPTVATPDRIEQRGNIVAVYRHIVPGRGQPELRFLSDGKIEGRNTTWKREGRKLILEWANPGDARWRDELWLSDDGSSYSGQNQGGVKIRGEAVSLSPEWNATGQQKSEQRPSKRLYKRESRQAPTLVEIRILRKGNWIYHPINYEGGRAYITRTDGSKAVLQQDGESLFFSTITGGRFGFDLRNQKTSADEPASFIYK